MSVTTVLSYYNKDYKDFRSLLTQEVPTQKLTKGEIPSLLAPCRSRNYALVGTAFDYYLRFTIEKKYKNVVSTKWVSELAIEQLSNLVENNSILKKYNHLMKEVNEKFLESQQAYRNYLIANNQDINTLLKSCLFLARLDLFFRGAIDPFDTLLMANVIEEDDIKDLLGVIEICDINYFKPKVAIMLNPTFGIASKMIGGADADLIIDRKLIDIKVTKEFRLPRPYLNQLLCYYLLSMIGGVDKAEDLQINELGIYYARHNFLWTIKVDKLAKSEQFDKMKNFLEQKLKNQAKYKFGLRALK